MDSQDDSKPQESDNHISPLAVRSVHLDPERSPDIGSVNSITLREGPRSCRTAKHTVIRNRNTGDYHHDSLTIQTFRKKQGQWRQDLESSVTISSDKGVDEIEDLRVFLQAARGGSNPQETGDYLVIRAPAGGIDTDVLKEALNALSTAEHVETVVSVLENLARTPELLHTLVERVRTDPKLVTAAATALNIARFGKAVDDLEALIHDPASREHDFQMLLQRNPWMFGSEYSELLDQRKWTRNEQQDFMLRRTSDGYIELVEIKTPLGSSALFGYDRSHDSYYALAELSKVVGQVEKYIEQLDANRTSIRVNDREDTLKICAKVIIGRDGDSDQQCALRRFNGHLYRIEVLTFDQLLRVAKNVLAYLEASIQT